MADEKKFTVRGFGFKYGSKEFVIAELLLAGKSREEVIKELASKVAEKQPFIYRENVGGSRRAKPRMDQYRLFFYTVSQTISKMENHGWKINEPYVEKRKWTSKEKSWVRWRTEYIKDLAKSGIIADPITGIKQNPLIPAPGTVKPEIKKPSENGEKVYYSQADLESMFSKLEADNLLKDITHEVDFDEYDDTERVWEEKNENGATVGEWYQFLDGKIERRKKNDLIDGKYENGGLIAVSVEPEPEPEPLPRTRAEEIDLFYEFMMRARDFVISRELSGEVVDFISTRAIRDGCKAIAHGIKIEEVMEAVTKTWPQDSKNELTTYTKMWKPKPQTIDYSKYKASLAGAHACLGYVEVLAKARIPIFLVGPSGSGKSFMMRDLADALEMNYGEIPLTAGATPSWLVGAETISGYKSRPFVEIYEDGGVFCFEEIDAADPNMLLLVNNALANESFTNPVTGQEIQKSQNFIAGATANTWGLGATRQYTGRERLDAATLDRWRVGRVEVDYDMKVEINIVDHWKKLSEKMEKPQKATKRSKVLV